MYPRAACHSWMPQRDNPDRHLQKCDGVLTFDAADYCPLGTETMRAWFAETGRKVHYAGPLIPSRPEDTAADPRSARILQFLDEKLATNGAKSVIYVRSLSFYLYLRTVELITGLRRPQISFGSMFWPMDNAKLLAVLDVLQEKNIPFVCHLF